MLGMAEVGVPVSRDGWQSIRIVGASAHVIFILLHKIQKMASKDMTFWVWPCGYPHMPMQTGDGETQLECSTTLC